jgi:hypothetical protein
LFRISITSVQVSFANDIVPDAANNLHFFLNVQSDRWLGKKDEFALSTRFVLDSPVSRRQHAAAN